MKPHSYRALVVLTLGTASGACFLAATSFSDQPPDRAATDASPRPKIDDVAAQIRFYAQRLDESLANADSYDESKQTRVEKDAVTISALAQLLGRCDGEHAIKSATRAIRASADQMATHCRDRDRAAAAYDRLKQALATDDTRPMDAPPEVAPSADGDAHAAATTALLMKQIRFIENRLKRAARSRSPSAKTRGDVAGHAATIAALAAPMAANAKQHAKDAQRQRLWVQQSEHMAAAAARLNAAAHDERSAGFGDAMRSLESTCTRCHADFR